MVQNTVWNAFSNIHYFNTFTPSFSPFTITSDNQQGITKQSNHTSFLFTFPTQGFVHHFYSWIFFWVWHRIFVFDSSLSIRLVFCIFFLLPIHCRWLIINDFLKTLKHLQSFKHLLHKIIVFNHMFDHIYNITNILYYYILILITILIYV